MSVFSHKGQVIKSAAGTLSEPQTSLGPNRNERNGHTMSRGLLRIGRREHNLWPQLAWHGQRCNPLPVISRNPHNKWLPCLVEVCTIGKPMALG